MEREVGKLKINRKTGEEKLRLNGSELEFNLLGFWQWSSSDLVSNALRGMLAEYIVACALRRNDGIRLEWDDYDLETEHGIRVEVKSSAYLQSWLQRGPSAICFNIAPTMGWDARTNTYGTERKRQADIYVFCLLSHQDKRTLDPLDLGQWQFYVLPAAILNEKLPTQKSISLGALLKLKPAMTDFENLRETIERQGETKAG